MEFDFYKPGRDGKGNVSNIPFFPISRRPTDKFVEYRLGRTPSRLDNLADEYYGDPRLYAIILMANPKYTTELDIPDGAVIRIPFPGSEASEEYFRKAAQSDA